MSRTAFFVICLVSIFVVAFVYLFLEIKKIENTQSAYVSQNTNNNANSNSTSVSTNSTQETTSANVVVSGSVNQSTLQNMIDAEINQAFASISASVSASPNIQSAGNKVTYIPISMSGQTNSTDWTTVDGSDFYVALQDYGKPTSITFQAILSVPNGSGTVSARLYNVTQNIAVSGSDVSASSIDYTLSSSGNLNLWSGNNLYVVQIKSLNSQDVSFGSGRIKILY